MKKLLILCLSLILTLTYSCKKDNDIAIKVKSVGISPSELSLTEGDEKQLTVTILPEDATNKSITWTCSDETIASVSKTGLVTALSEGEVTITATTEDNLATCALTVKKPQVVMSIEVDPNSYNLKIGESFTINPVILPEDAVDKKYKIEINKPELLSKDGTKFTALESGQVTVTLRSLSNDNAYCEISVSIEPKVIPLEKIESTSPLKLMIGETATIALTFTPEDATNKKVTFTSLTPDCASVDENGLVTALKEGNSIISVTSKENKDVTLFVGVIVETPGPAAIVPAELIGSWSVEKIGIVMYGWESTEAQMLVDYPSMEEQFRFNKTQFKFTFNNDDSIDLIYIDKDKVTHNLKGVLTLKDADKKIYTGTFEGTEDNDAKINDFYLIENGFKMSLNSLSGSDITYNATMLYFSK